MALVGVEMALVGVEMVLAEVEMDWVEAEKAQAEVETQSGCRSPCCRRLRSTRAPWSQ